LIDFAAEQDRRQHAASCGGLVWRALVQFCASYAISRTFITKKNDRGANEFNISEIGGNASEAVLSNLYYPAAESGFRKSAKTSLHRQLSPRAPTFSKSSGPTSAKTFFRMKDEFPRGP
jgi:hypothetical protein